MIEKHVNSVNLIVWFTGKKKYMIPNKHGQIKSDDMRKYNYDIIMPLGTALSFFMRRNSMRSK